MSTSPVSRAATAGLVGGALWALMPLAFAFPDPEGTPAGTAGHITAGATARAFLVLPPVLIVAGLTALRTALGPDAGRVGATGIALAATGLTGMAVGNGIEVASLTAGGGEVAAGHATFLVGFLVSVVGSLLVGITVVRRRHAPVSRIGGVLLALALPLGIGVGALASAVAPGNDAGFFAAISVPTGIAWVVLGSALRSDSRPAAPRYAPVPQ